jgi:hypothetical protein
MKDLKTFTDAAKLDVLNLLSKDTPHIFEFRRAAEICGIAAALCGDRDEQMSIGRAIHAAEDKAPLLHSALVGRAFDGEAMLQDKYEELKAHHTELRHKALDADLRTTVWMSKCRRFRRRTPWYNSKWSTRIEGSASARSDP